MKPINSMSFEDMDTFLGSLVSMNDISTLKIGEKVLMSFRQYGEITYKIGIVERRTPSGRVIISGVAFKPNGIEYGSGLYSGITSLYKLDDSIYSVYTHRAIMINKRSFIIKNIKTIKLSTKSVNSIYNVLLAQRMEEENNATNSDEQNA